MSFDIRVTSGDLELGSNGDAATVVNSDKLAQDVIKVLNTPIGSSPLNPTYGSTLTVAQLGQVIDVEAVISQTTISIASALEQLVATQAQQKSFQIVTDAETIVDFESPIVEPDPVEPRQFNIVVNAISRDLTPISIALVVKF